MPSQEKSKLNLSDLISRIEDKKKENKINPNYISGKVLDKNFYAVFDEDYNHKEEDFKSYYKFSVNTTANSLKFLLWKWTVGLPVKKGIGIILFFGLLTSFENNPLNRYCLMVTLFYIGNILYFMLMERIVIKNISMNWISYMRYILKHQLKKEDNVIDEITELLIYENEGIHSNWRNDLMNGKYMAKQKKILDYVKVKYG